MRKIDTQNFRRATRDTSREVNRLIILNLIRERGPISRAEIARIMKVPRGMVTSLVTELLDEGLVVEGKTKSAPRGRRPTLLHIRSHHRLAVGVDIGVNETQVLLADFSGQAIARESFPTVGAPEEMTVELGRRVKKMLKGHSGRCEGLGVVVPGMVDESSGVVLNAPVLGWNRVDLQRLLNRSIDVPVYAERDAVACAVAQMWLDAQIDDAPRDFAYLLVSDGVGAGLVFGGQPMRGAHKAAGEYGHVPLDLEGPECSCGSRGCVETFASDLATLARYLDHTFDGRHTRKVVRGAGISMRDLVKRAVVDERARQEIETTARYLGVALASIVNSLNPERVVVGGDIVGRWDVVEPLLRAGIAQRALTEEAAKTIVDADPDHYETRLRGAAALVVAQAFAAPVVA